MSTRLRSLLALVVLLPIIARAHSPSVLSPGAPTVIEDTSISYALYGVFETGDEVFRVKLSFPEDFALPVEVFVPHRDELKEHRPAFALVGPGLLFEPMAEERAALPLPLPAGAGAYVDLNRVSPRPVFYETFTRRFFWSTGAVALVVPKGDYELWMWSPNKTRGKFGIGFGVEEGGDFSRAFEDWSVYAY